MWDNRQQNWTKGRLVRWIDITHGQVFRLYCWDVSECTLRHGLNDTLLSSLEIVGDDQTVRQALVGSEVHPACTAS